MQTEYTVCWYPTNDPVNLQHTAFVGKEAAEIAARCVRASYRNCVVKVVTRAELEEMILDNIDKV